MSDAERDADDVRGGDGYTSGGGHGAELWFCIVNDSKSTCVQDSVMVVRLVKNVFWNVDSVVFPLAADCHQVQPSDT